MKRIRGSLALKLILASAIPSAVVLLAGLGALLAHSRHIALTNPALAFEELTDGAVVGTLLALTFAGMTVALAVRHFLVKPIQALSQVMARAELGEFLVRARVQSEDELGKLSKSFNTMLSRVTDMAVTEIETEESMLQLEGSLTLQAELKGLNQQLAEHVREMELLLEVSKAVSGTLDLPEQLQELGKQVCARLSISEFSVMLLDETTHQLVIEAVAGEGAAARRGRRVPPGAGPTRGAAADGQNAHLPGGRQGHPVGDGVLRGVALALRSNVRKIDVVARYGGEEFCIVQPRVGKPEALEVAEKLRRAVSAAALPGPEGKGPLRVTISIGVATLGIDADDVGSLVEKADVALYEAKRLGRDQVSMAVPNQRASA